MDAVLPAPVPLEAETIAALLRQQGVRLPQIEVLPEVASTNRYLLEAPMPVSGVVCLAEAQRHGRGRHGREWITTARRNLMLSFAWHFETPASALAGLSLAAGLGVSNALERQGVAGTRLKWPNDICWGSRKLCGVLTESRPHGARGVRAVIGVGINVLIGPDESARIDQPWVDLHEIVGVAPDRNRLAAAVIAGLWNTCERYAVSGFEGFRAEWNARHAFNGKSVQWFDGAQRLDGAVLGANADGALEVRVNGGQIRTFHSGEISLRQDMVMV